MILFYFEKGKLASCDSRWYGILEMIHKNYHVFWRNQSICEINLLTELEAWNLRFKQLVRGGGWTRAYHKLCRGFFENFWKITYFCIQLRKNTWPDATLMSFDTCQIYHLSNPTQHKSMFWQSRNLFMMVNSSWFDQVFIMTVPWF